jgi:hypothetical protein
MAEPVASDGWIPGTTEVTEDLPPGDVFRQWLRLLFFYPLNNQIL